MFWLYFLGTLIGVPLLLAFIAFWVGEAIRAQAKKGRFFAHLPPPGQFFFVVTGAVGSGVINKIVSNVPKAILNVRRRFIPAPGDPEVGWLEKNLGVTWIGLYGEVGEKKKMEWPETHAVEVKSDGQTLVEYHTTKREENVSTFHQQFSYSLVLRGVELAGNIKAKMMKMEIIIHILDPEDAIFLNKAAATTLLTTVSAAIRSWIYGKEFDTVAAIVNSPTEQQRSDPNDQTFWEMIQELNGIEVSPNGTPEYDGPISPRGLFKLYGVRVVAINLVEIEAEDEARKALEAKMLTQLKGEAAITATELEAERKRKEAEGDADALRIKTAARQEWVQATIVGPTGGPGEHVADVLTAEQIAGGNQTTFVQGSKGERSPALIAIPPSSGKGPRKEP